MQVINGNRIRIILDEEEQVEISSLKGNKTCILVSLKNGTLEIDDVPLEKIKNLKEEEESIKKMEEYFKKNPKK